MKSTFLGNFESVIKFYESVYHLHKAAFKGLNQFFKSYSKVHRSFSTALMDLSKDSLASVAQYSKDLPFVQEALNDISGSLERNAQLHFSHAEKLEEMAAEAYYHYEESKRIKDREMKALKDKSQKERDLAEYARDRNVLNECQRAICLRLYNALDTYTEEEKSRSQKFRESMVIFFSVSHKISQKQIELSASYHNRTNEQIPVIRLERVSEIEQILVAQHNSYGLGEIKCKARGSLKPAQRQSLMESTFMRERLIKQENHQSQLKQTLSKFSDLAEQLLQRREIPTVGLFDADKIPFNRDLARQIDSKMMFQISLDMLSGYYRELFPAKKHLLSQIQSKLGLPLQAPLNAPSPVEYLRIVKQSKKSKAYKAQVGLLLTLSRIYKGEADLEVLGSYQQWSCPQNEDFKMSPQVGVVLLDYLLNSAMGSGDALLDDNFTHILKYIAEFGTTYCGIESPLTLLIMLRKIQKHIEVRNIHEQEPIQDLLECHLGKPIVSEEQRKMAQQMGEEIEYLLLKGLIYFFKSKAPLGNLVKISLVLQDAVGKQNFEALECVSECLTASGYEFMRDCGEAQQLLQSNTLKGELILKNLVDMLENLHFQEVYSVQFEPAALEVSSLLNIGLQMCLNKMKQQFAQAAKLAVEGNLKVAAEQEGVDKQGYVLRLGVCLATLNDFALDQYGKSTYFSVLERYLTATEIEYGNLMEHSRKTELWMVQENCQATNSCLDFCNILYKPFQFLLTSLRSLDKDEIKTEFTIKFSALIKLRLNSVLKVQIMKYLDFLLASLSNYPSIPEIQLKNKRGIEVQRVTSEKKAEKKTVFRELARRLGNLLFLKEQLRSIMDQFLDPVMTMLLKTSQKSIFDLQLLKSAADKSPSRDILLNVHEIVAAIHQMQGRIVNRVAEVGIIVLLDQCFSNLYRQNEKNAIQEFFAGKQDYKLSEFTLVKIQLELENTFALLLKTVPEVVLPQFCTSFLRRFFLMFRVEVLNSSKFKFPFVVDEVKRYLDSDITFVATMLRQNYMDEEIVRRELVKPVELLLRDLQLPTLKLMTSFEDANVKHSREDCLYILALLNLRLEENAQEFVKKFKLIATR